MNMKKIPRGIRNNNPANILRSGQRWFGLSKVQTDKRFCKFDKMEYGVRAFFLLARTYRKKYGITTVERFIERFAPAIENDVKAYVAYISPSFAVTSGSLNSDFEYSRFLYCIIRYENYLDTDDMCDLHLQVIQLEQIRRKYNINIV